MIFLSVLLFTAAGNPASHSAASQADPRFYLLKGRSQFASSVEQPEYIAPASASFTRLAMQSPELASRALVYQGALKAIEGKHSFGPQDKLARVNEALEMMDSGLAARPNDIEALFVHANICYNLPFFFGRRTAAEAHYQRILMLLPDNWQQYDRGFIIDMVEYMSLNLPMSSADLLNLRAVSEKIKKEL